jgi:hypothetical protein
VNGVYAPNPGDIGMTQIHGRVGLGIRAGQWANGDGFADYEHAMVYVGAGQVIEAEPGGALLSDLSRYGADRVIWLKCPAANRTAVAAAARTYKDVPYSFADYDALAVHRLHIPVPGLEDYIRSTGHMICSQLADKAAMDGGWHLFDDGRWEGFVTPGSLHRLYLVQEQRAA